MYTVKIATIKEFEESKEVWNKLASAMPIPSIFCTWEWIYTWWEHFGLNYKALILFVYKDSELKGILPLASHRTLLSRGWATGRILTYCGSRELYPDHLDIITSKEDADECITAVFDFLLSNYTEWDVIYLSHVREGNFIASRMHDGSFPFDVEIKRASVAPYIRLSSSFEEFTETLSHNLRKNLRKRKQKLCEHYDFIYTSCDTSDIDKALATLFDLHARRAKRKNIVSTFNEQQIFRFHSALLHRIMKKGWVWMRYIGNNEQVIAASYCFIFGGRVCAYQKGIDPEWEHYGTGTLINYETIKEAFGNRCSEFDFLRGDEEHKANWTQTKRLLFDINVYNKTFSAVISKTSLYVKTSLAKAGKKLFGRV
jgi:hypothetical protein